MRAFLLIKYIQFVTFELAQIYDFLAPLNGQVNANALALIRRANEALDGWWSSCDELHRQCCSRMPNHAETDI